MRRTGRIIISNDTINIIKAKKEHLKSIIELENRSFGCDAFNSRQFCRAINSPNCIFIIAISGFGLKEINNDAQKHGKLITNQQLSLTAGYAIGTIRKIKSKTGTKKYGRVYSIAVSPEFKGRSIGAKLLQELENKLCEAGCCRIYLEVRTDNNAAINLYNKFNYKKIGTIENYYHDASPAFKFFKETSMKHES